MSTAASKTKTTTEWGLNWQCRCHWGHTRAASEAHARADAAMRPGCQSVVVRRDVTVTSTRWEPQEDQEVQR
jgi:hypothetical protein